MSSMHTIGSGMHNAKVPHDDRCRDRIGELMAGDDDQRQVERMMSRTTADVENDIPCPETGEEVDVGAPSVQPRSVDEDQPRPETQSVPRPVHCGTPWYAVVRSSRVQTFLEYMAKYSLNFGRAPDPSRDRGGTPRWGLMAESVACCTQFFRCSPLVPVQ